MNKEQNHKKTTQLLVLAVFAVFGLCLAAVLLTGAGTYRNLVQQGRQAHDRRVAARYVTTRFRQGTGVEFEDFQGVSAMTLREEIGGKIYLTRVYCYEGSIRELFSGEQTAVSPGDGQIILEANGLSFERDGNLLRVCIIHTDGTEQRLLLSLSAGKGDSP